MVFAAGVVVAAIIYYLVPIDMEVPSVGILHMDNLGSEEDDFWARAITEDLIIDVASLGMTEVTPMREILRNVKAEMSLDQIAKTLGVRYLLTSSIQRTGRAFNLKCQLIETKTGKSVYAKKWSEPMDNVTQVTSTLATDILNEIGVPLDQEEARLNTIGLGKSYYEMGDYVKSVITLTPTFTRKPLLNNITFEVLADLFFDAGSAIIDQSAVGESFLEKMQAILPKILSSYVTVECHTDNQPPPQGSKYASNYELSIARASQIMVRLIKMGVSQEKLRSVGYADMFPRYMSRDEIPSPEITSKYNKTEEMRKRNRRIVIKFLSKEEL